MKMHCHFAGRILCGQANAKNVPLWHFAQLESKGRCKRCERKRISFGESRDYRATTPDGGQAA